MKWVDEGSNKVDKVVGHVGLEVKWEYKKVNDAGAAVICDFCQERNHKVTSK
ncbi:Fc.00g038870.m01.CDS01 [Cosmosporella sp. VM-42]